MKIHLLSDIHTELWRKTAKFKLLEVFKPVKADVLVLAGDIGSGRTNVRKVLREFSPHYRHVVYVPGNHEYYNTSIEVQDRLTGLPANVHYLNPGAARIDEVTFIGAPLWTNFRGDPIAAYVARLAIADFKLIKDFTPADATAIFEKHLTFITQYIRAHAGRKVMVTHFLPATECVSPRWAKPQHETLNKYFANDLGDWISMLEDTTWLFGHTHDSVDIRIGSTRLVSNPFGYPHELNTGFSPNLVIEI